MVFPRVPHELDVTVHIENVGAAGDVVERDAGTTRRTPPELTCVPHHRNLTLCLGRAGRVVDIRDEEPLDPFFQTIYGRTVHLDILINEG